MPEKIKLLVVIVCYKATDLTIDCLRSIASQIDQTPNVQVAVCENGTSEEAAEELACAIEDNGWSEWCWLKVISPNRGFSGGNNVILEDALSWDIQPELFLLLNADTIVRQGAIKTLLDAADLHNEAGIISPRLEWPDGMPQISCFRYINPVSEFLEAAKTGPITKLLRRYEVPIPVKDTPSEPQWTTFACALIRREVFQQIGLLDPGYFLYFDDPDFCRRARKAGWSVLNWPAARVVHLRGKSNPVKERTANLQRRPSYFYVSRARYFAKFYSPIGLWYANALWSLGRIISYVREKIGRKAKHVCESEVKDIWINWSHPLRDMGVRGDETL